MSRRHEGRHRWRNPLHEYQEPLNREFDLAQCYCHNPAMDALYGEHLRLFRISGESAWCNSCGLECDYSAGIKNPAASTEWVRRDCSPSLQILRAAL